MNNFIGGCRYRISKLKIEMEKARAANDKELELRLYSSIRKNYFWISEEYRRIDNRRFWTRIWFR